jgi:glycosyltransferase involved in cell wall biosynthesis
MNKKIKVLFISHSSSMWGAERSLFLLLKHINRNKFEPIMVLPSSGLLKDEIDRLKITTYIIKSPWWIDSKNKAHFFKSILRHGKKIIFEILALLKIYKIIRKEKIDIIYTNTIVNFSGALISLFYRIPHVWHIREILEDNPNLSSFLSNKIIFSFISKTSKIVIANSFATASQFDNIKSKGKLEVIHNAVEIQNFKNKKISINKSNNSDWIVAVIGALQIRKGQEDVIKAVKIVKKNMPNVKLYIVGDGDKEYKKHLENLIIKLDLEESVIFTGYRNDVPKLLPKFKVVIMPSWNEPFGRVAIEAMATGIPVIAVNVGGPKEIVEEGISGYLVPPRCPKLIAQKIIYLYQNSSIRIKLGNNAKIIAEEKFTFEKYTEKIENILYKLILRD